MCHLMKTYIACMALYSIYIMLEHKCKVKLYIKYKSKKIKYHISKEKIHKYQSYNFELKCKIKFTYMTYLVVYG